MYLLIIEGTDNIGKDTLKNQLIDLFDTVTLIHCSSPKSRGFKSYEQDKTFLTYADNIVNGVYDGTECIIMNRSHYGEYVYGQIYRHRNPIEISSMINDFDKLIDSRIDLKVKYIQLLSTSLELRKKYDDNKSLSLMDEQKMEIENKLFMDVYNQSKFDKKLIYVNDGDNFRHKEDIYKEALDFINS